MIYVNILAVNTLNVLWYTYTMQAVKFMLPVYFIGHKYQNYK